MYITFGFLYILYGSIYSKAKVPYFKAQNHTWTVQLVIFRCHHKKRFTSLFNNFHATSSMNPHLSNILCVKYTIKQIENYITFNYFRERATLKWNPISNVVIKVSSAEGKELKRPLQEKWNRLSRKLLLTTRDRGVRISKTVKKNP